MEPSAAVNASGSRTGYVKNVVDRLYKMSWGRGVPQVDAVVGGIVGAAMLRYCPGNRFRSHRLFLMINVSSGCSSHRPQRSGFGENQSKDDSLN